MKKTIAVLIAVLILFCPIHIAAQINAEAYVLTDAGSGKILSSKNENERHEPASTTKILTALVALENAPLDSIFTVSEKAAAVEGSGIGIEAGEKISFEDLLYMLLLKSGNDAAVTIAENIAGSEKDFAELMNKRAAEIGCKNSHFSNPHGLHYDEHYTTAYDLALIAAEALKNETFAKIVSTREKTLSYKKLTIRNSNKLLEDELFTGMKTGFTKAAGRCLVSSAKKDGVTIVCVTMKDPDDWRDHKEIMSEGLSRVSSFVLYKTGEFAEKSPLLGGKTDGIYTNIKEITGSIIDGKKCEYTVVSRLYPVIFAPAKKYSAGGYLEIKCGDFTVGKIPLCLSETVETSEELGGFELFSYNLRKLLKTLL